MRGPEGQFFPLNGRLIPTLSVMAGSLAVPLLPVVSQSPVMPPVGLLVLLAWRLLNPELWPLWIGLILGTFDDLATGRPVGMGMCLWSIILIMLESAESRLLWRDYWHDWLLVAGAVTFYLSGALLLTNILGSETAVTAIIPQIIWSVLLYPFIVRIVAALDRWRLKL